MPIIRDDLDLTSKMTGYAGTCAVIGAVFSRVCMGMICDVFGPRVAFSMVLIATSIPCFAMSCVTGFAGFAASRFFIGFGLATFVTCQYWCSTMFTPKIVGGANAIAGGWGNMGGGLTQIIIPIVATLISRNYNNDNRAWRQTYFLPGCLHIAAGLAIYFLGVDKPDGNVVDLKASGDIKVGKDESWRTFKNAVTNYRTWVFVFSCARPPAELGVRLEARVTGLLSLPAHQAFLPVIARPPPLFLPSLPADGFCFGVELVVDNILADYFNAEFGAPAPPPAPCSSMYCKEISHACVHCLRWLDLLLLSCLCVLSLLTHAFPLPPSHPLQA